MRQQLANLTGLVRGQALQHVAQIGMRIVAIELGRLDQTHDDSRALACQQRARKQPVLAPNGNGPDLVLDPVVVDGQPAVVDEARERLPPLEAVVQGFGRGTTIGHLAALRQHLAGFRPHQVHITVRTTQLQRRRTVAAKVQ